MSKYHRINWRESDNKELARVVRNFNAKVTRLKNKNPLNEKYLPEKIQVSDLKSIINTRQDLKRELNSLKRFSKRGAEEIVSIPDTDNNLKTTKWQRTEMNRRVANINKRRAHRLQEELETELKSRGQPLGYTKAQIGMGRPEHALLQPMKPFYRTMDQFSLKERFKSILVQSQSDYFTNRDLQTRESYIKGIINNYDYENVKDIVEHIRNMDISEFLTVFRENGSTFEIASPTSLYTREEIDFGEATYDAYESALRAIWLPNKKQK